jgi:hypothetical protein
MEPRALPDERGRQCLRVLERYRRPEDVSAPVPWADAPRPAPVLRCKQRGRGGLLR